ncbi:MAG: acid phosphatase, partial [Halieaceae bacterium]
MITSLLKGSLAIGVLLSCHAIAEPSDSTDVPEIRPGLLMGYLPMDNPLRSDEFVPPPPAAGSAAQAADDAFSAQLLATQDKDRFELARADAHLGPDSTATFSCAVGINISQEDTPHLQMLLRRTLTDLGLA